MAKLEETQEKIENTEKAAERNTEEKNPSWMIKVKGNPNFCGIGAGGVQFANGQAVISSERMAEWFMEHGGYEVISQ